MLCTMFFKPALFSLKLNTRVVPLATYIISHSRSVGKILKVRFVWLTDAGEIGLVKIKLLNNTKKTTNSSL